MKPTHLKHADTCEFCEHGEYIQSLPYKVVCKKHMLVLEEPLVCADYSVREENTLLEYYPMEADDHE